MSEQDKKGGGIDRRNFLKGMAAVGLGSMFGGLPFRASAEKPLVIGFIYVGPKGDYGYNQAHAEGAAAVAKLPWVRVLEEENVPETVDVQKAMQSMINLDGAGLIFPTSFGYYNPHVMKVAPKYAKTAFLHCGGLYQAGHPANAGSYFGFIDEAQYVAGVVAGHTSKTGKLGFIGAKPIPQVLRNINAFTLGARSVNPAITTRVVFTGDWAMPTKEAEAANSLIDQGVDVITCHVDSPKVIVETCEKRGVYSSGYHTNQSAVGPKGYLTGAEWNWSKVYVDFATWHRDGVLFERASHMYRGGLQAGLVRVSPYGPAVGEKARNHAESVVAKFMRGETVIFKGEIKDNQGRVVIPGGTERVQTDPWLESMDWLVEGVIGSARA